MICDTYTPQGDPLPSNTRAIAMKAFQGHEDEEIWFGLEQEFTLFNLDQRYVALNLCYCVAHQFTTHLKVFSLIYRTPLGWPVGGFPDREQGPYYCSVGPENNFGRAITDSLYRCLLYAGIACSGTNGEVMPGQQEYQVGPCVGIDAADQLTASRYILMRVCEDFQVFCTLHPKPMVRGEWNGGTFSGV